MRGFSIEFNTFTICVRCPRTGALEFCTATGGGFPFVRKR